MKTAEDIIISKYPYYNKLHRDIKLEGYAVEQLMQEYAEHYHSEKLKELLSANKDYTNSFQALKDISGLLKDEISDEQFSEMIKDIHR